MATKTKYKVEDALGKQDITEFFSDEKLEEIGIQCVADFKTDDADFDSRRDRIIELYKLALQTYETKNYPFENASNIKYPLLTKAALNFAAMAYPAIVKDDQVVKAKVIGSDKGGDVVMDSEDNPMIDEDTGKEMRKNAGLKAERAERVSTFTSYQVLEEMDGWEDDMDKLLHIIPIVGCCFKKIYRDSKLKQSVSRLVLSQFLIANIDAKTTKDASRLSELFDLYENEIEENIRLGIFKQFDYGTSTETQGDSYKQDKDGAGGTDEDKPHAFIEQHRRLDLDEDGYTEPYIVFIHKATGKVVRILPRFSKDGIEKKDNEIQKIEPEVHYEKYGLIPDPEGSFYDIGFGHLLQHINVAANTSINQLIDAGHRNVMGGGFVGKGLRLKSGDLKFRPGEYKRIDSRGLSIREHVYPLPMPEPSVVLMSLWESLIKSAEEMALMTAIISGDLPANTPATTALAMIEQSLQPFKAVFKRIHRSLKREFSRLTYLNSKYLTQEEYNRVLDEDADVKEDFNLADVNVTPVSDPDMVSSTQVLMTAQALEMYKDDPFVDQLEIRKRIFKAMGVKDINTLIKIPPKVEDELVEAQKAALQAQIEDLNRDNERKDLEHILKIEESRATIILKSAQAVKALAEAEEKEEGPQLEYYKLQLQELDTRMKSDESFGGRNKPVEAKSNNKILPQVS